MGTSSGRWSLECWPPTPTPTPTFLVFEEPTVGVDVGARQDIWTTIRSLAQGRTIIVVSSEAEELVATCDRVVCLRAGTTSAVLAGDGVNELAIARAIV